MIFLKILISLAVILAATWLARKAPSLAGLIATMPLAGLLVLVWVWQESGGNAQRMTAYARGALWGIGPSILFYLAAWWAFQRGWPLPAVLGLGFGVWLAGALVHQAVLR